MERQLDQIEECARNRRLSDYLDQANQLAEEAKLPIVVQPRIVPGFLEPTDDDDPTMWRYFVDGELDLRIAFELFTKDGGTLSSASLPTLWWYHLDDFIDLMDKYAATGESDAQAGCTERIWQPVPQLPLGQAFLYLAQLAHQSVAESEALPILDVYGEHLGELHLSVKLLQPPCSLGSVTMDDGAAGTGLEPKDKADGLLDTGFRFSLEVKGLILKPAARSPSSAVVYYSFDATGGTPSPPINQIKLTRRSSEDVEGSHYDPTDDRNDGRSAFVHMVKPGKLTEQRLAYLLAEAISFCVDVSGDGISLDTLPHGNLYDLDHFLIDQETGLTGIRRARHECINFVDTFSNACLMEQERQREQLRGCLNTWRKDSMSTDALEEALMQRMSFGEQLRSEMRLDVVQGALKKNQTASEEESGYQRKQKQKQLEEDARVAAELRRREERRKKYFANASAAKAAMTSLRMEKEEVDRKFRELRMEHDEYKQKHQKEMIQQQNEMQQKQNKIAEERQLYEAETKAKEVKAKEVKAKEAKDRELEALRNENQALLAAAAAKDEELRRNEEFRKKEEELNRRSQELSQREQAMREPTQDAANSCDHKFEDIGRKQSTNSSACAIL